MSSVHLFFRCVGEAVLAKGARALVSLVPFGAEAYDIAADIFQRWRAAHSGTDAHQALRRELEEAIQVPPAQFEDQMRQLVAEVAANAAAATQRALQGYLSLVPAHIRQTFSRSDDPSGTTLPITFEPRRPEDFLSLLPPRAPRFCAGDQPPRSRNWVLVERLGVGGFGEVWKARHTLLADRLRRKGDADIFTRARRRCRRRVWHRGRRGRRSGGGRGRRSQGGRPRGCRAMRKRGHPNHPPVKKNVCVPFSSPLFFALFFASPFLRLQGMLLPRKLSTAARTAIPIQRTRDGLGQNRVSPF